MSASNWRVCPACKRKAEEARQAAKEKARKAYGKVSLEEYTAMVAAANEPNPAEQDETLREDWEIGIRDGVFQVSYSGCCQRCAFEFRFNHEAKV